MFPLRSRETTPWMEEVERCREQPPWRYTHRDVGGRLRREPAVEGNAGSSCREGLGERVPCRGAVFQRSPGARPFRYPDPDIFVRPFAALSLNSSPACGRGERAREIGHPFSRREKGVSQCAHLFPVEREVRRARVTRLLYLGREAARTILAVCSVCREDETHAVSGLFLIPVLSRRVVIDVLAACAQFFSEDSSSGCCARR
jgi:hypothetical protein